MMLISCFGRCWMMIRCTGLLSGEASIACPCRPGAARKCVDVMVCVVDDESIFIMDVFARTHGYLLPSYRSSSASCSGRVLYMYTLLPCCHRQRRWAKARASGDAIVVLPAGCTCQLPDRRCHVINMYNMLHEDGDRYISGPLPAAHANAPALFCFDVG